MAGFLPDATAFYLKHCVKACNGVERSHIVPFAWTARLLELFTHDGVGTMISHENLESCARPPSKTWAASSS
jgi:amino-acid N-acetyltransferase